MHDLLMELNYTNTYTALFGIIGLIVFNGLSRYTADGLLYSSVKYKDLINFVFVFIVIFVGTRPLKAEFVDMGMYWTAYNEGIVLDRDLLSEPGFGFTRVPFLLLGLPSECWFTFVALIYYGCVLWAAKRLSPNNYTIIFLMFVVCFSTFSFATNTIRNGFACSLVLLGISFWGDNKHDRIRCIIIMLMALLVHKSTMLPIGCFIVSMFWGKITIRTAIYFWFFSIIVSLVAGDAAAQLFTNLGFDNRLDSYIGHEADLDTFSRIGFRWDFLLYGAVPIYLARDFSHAKSIDPMYILFIKTYILANAFWVMICRSAFADRFGYLSWFLFPMVIAYPLVKMDIYGARQGRKASLILSLLVLFTLFMRFIYYGGRVNTVIIN